jgi:hypothetical protein
LKLAALVVLVASCFASSAAAATTRTETIVQSTAPDAPQVGESYVQLYAPLPASVPAHPAACDWIGYLRFWDRSTEVSHSIARHHRIVRHHRRRHRHRRHARRHHRHTREHEASAPSSPTSTPPVSRADAIIVAMPGFLGGAADFDQLARHTIELAAAHGRHLEFWALDRRANCLEDHRGSDAAARAHNYLTAVNYYFHGAQIDGHRFAGFRTSDQVPFLADVGIAQTLRDEYTAITRGVPDPAVRKRKVFCGGHSLGGPLTGAFAGWDFDGNPSTTTDAGYNQCAGFFGLDTSLSVGSSQSGTPGISQAADALVQYGGQGRFFDAPPATPASIQLLGPIGVAAYQDPGAESRLLANVPDTPDINLSNRVLFARNAAELATGTPSVRDFRFTNETALGGVFDDNSDPIPIFRASIGVYDGGPVQEKDFPLPEPLAGSGGQNRLMAPSTPNGPLYTWRHYDQLTAPGAPHQVDSTGQPFTSPASEVTDIHQLARTMFEAPADFTEQYFPTRLLTDDVAAESGDRSGDLQNLTHTDVPLHPSLLIEAGEGIGGSGADKVVTLTGYNHLDVATAAARQNNGKPEGASSALSGFVLGALAR